MFQDANDFEIPGSHLTNVQGDVNIHPILTAPSTVSTAATSSSALSPQPPIYSVGGRYSRQLLHEGRGFPMYVPAPQRTLPPQYQRKGIAIGDVGSVTSEGIFDFFFNIYLPADDPINANVPEDFVPLSPYSLSDVIYEDYEPGDYVSTPSIEEINGDFSDSAPGGEFVFHCSAPNGAVLALPHGAHLQKLRNIANMRRYAAKHAESWYKHVNGTRGRELANGGLHLITGCEKAKSWGIASFHDVSVENEFHLSFGPTAYAEAGYKYRWQGSLCRHKHADAPPVDETPLNQTTFIHAFTISLNEGLWGKLFGGVDICQLADAPSSSDKSGGFVPFGSQGSSWLSLRFFGSSAPHQGKQCAGRAPVREDALISDASPVPKVFHPSQIIHERIFREAPQGKVVITHDDDWRDVFMNCIPTDEQDFSGLQQRIFDRFDILEEEGTAFIVNKPESLPAKGTIPCTQDIALGDPRPSMQTGEVPPLSPLNDQSAERLDSSIPANQPSTPLTLAVQSVTQRPRSPDEMTLDIEEDYMKISSSLEFCDGAGQATFRDSSPQSDLTASFPNPSMGIRNIRAHRLGEQFAGPSLASTGGSRRRAQSDNASFQLPEIPHTSHYDNLAVADEDSPPSDLPPITDPHPLSPLHLSPRWNSAPGSDLPPITIPHPGQPNAPWVATRPWNDPVEPSLKPPPRLLLSPGWRSGPESDTSSPPSSSHSRFLSLSPFPISPPELDGAPSPYTQTSALDVEPTIRGGIKRLSKGSSSSHSSYPSASALDGLPMGALSNQDGTSGEPNFSNFDSYYAPLSPGSQPGLLLPENNSFSGPSWPLDNASTGPVDGGSQPYPPHHSNRFSSPSSDQTQPSNFRHSIATAAVRRAAAARRKDPNKRGAFVCQYCCHDFTAMHNLKNHLKSHFSDKQHKCGLCDQAFVTAHVLKRHKRTCKAAASSVKKKKRAT
ncbi:hypothetical protein DFH06DRAFT_504972 [Mycena polygramma]|nr:hypothetical protein DFH06DRAFT_504972 [Mycena polygramma]